MLWNLFSTGLRIELFHISIGKHPLLILSSWKRFISKTMAASHFKRSANAYLDKTLINRYRRLKLSKNAVQVTYLWIDGTGENIRGKDRILNHKVKSLNDIPLWSYDGSSTYQASGEESDLYLIPQAIYQDPFKPGKNDILVICETTDPEGAPTKWNHRREMKKACDAASEQKPWFGIEQEYTLLGADNRPYGWPDNGYPAPQGPYYCSVGGTNAFGRDIVESHVLACLYAGIAIAGTNAEVLPSQWEFQVGIAEGIKAADDLWVARYILKRIAEQYGVDVTLDPKPIPGNWNGSGAHTNFSTKAMREDGGLDEIKLAIEKLAKRHCQHIAVYDPKGGEDNIRRLHGQLETSEINRFSWGIGSRGVSVRIPQIVADNGKGFLEDRRPAANCDPYAVCNALIRTCILDDVK